MTQRTVVMAALAAAIAIAGVLLTLQACQIEAAYRGRLDVWNRTLTPIGVVGREETFRVPACDHVVRDEFVLNRYNIVDAQGRLIAWHGGGGSNPARVLPAYEMVTRDGAVFSDMKPPPEPLPACKGVVTGQ